MRRKTLTALTVATFASIAGAAFAADTTPTGQPTSVANIVAVSADPAPTNRFRSLDRIVAVPMSRADLSSVRGEHIHFLDASGTGPLRFAGSFHDHNGDGVPDNWLVLGGSDGRPVAPSYHGLCVAQAVGVGGISIPGAAVQC